MPFIYGRNKCCLQHGYECRRFLMLAMNARASAAWVRLPYICPSMAANAILAAAWLCMPSLAPYGHTCHTHCTLAMNAIVLQHGYGCQSYSSKAMATIVDSTPLRVQAALQHGYECANLRNIGTNATSDARASRLRREPHLTAYPRAPRLSREPPRLTREPHGLSQ